MKQYILLRKLTEDPRAVDYKQRTERPKMVVLKVAIGASDCLWIIRYAYYAFVVSYPFEAAKNIGVDIGLSSWSKLVGYAFMLATLLQPRLCFKFPPKAFWLFTIYLCVVALMGILQDPYFYSLISTQLFTQTQVLILFWVSYNLLRYEQIRKGTLWALAVSCFILAIMQALGITSEALDYGDRVSAFGVNPNQFGWVLSMGALALVGLAYGQENINLKVRLLTWLSFGVFVAAIVRTGSRGATVGLVAGFMAFMLKGRSLGTKLKVGFIVLLGIGSLVWASFYIEAVRIRWEKTFFEGSMAGREKIFPAAWELFLEEPLFGWGPVRHYFELGSRLGLRTRDPHNLYLWLLLETGLLGTGFFFAGLWLCWHAAWKARHSIQGVVPVAMMLCILVNNAKGTGLNDKLSWVVLAYALASSSSVSPPWRWRQRGIFLA